jgi:hypothetical protein
MFYIKIVYENIYNTSNLRIALDTINTVVNNFISEGCANYSFISILIFKILNK